MKFGRKAITLSLLGLTSSVNAFMVNHASSSLSSQYMKQSQLAGSSSSTTEVISNQTESKSTTKSSSLNPEFQAYKEQVVTSISSAISTPSLVNSLSHFANEYFSACQEALNDGNTSVSAKTTAAAFSQALTLGMTHGLQNKYKFGVTHKALRGDPETEDGNTVDFYKFGCDFFYPTMNPKTSLVLGLDDFEKAKEQLANGENVIFLANHQSEADPQVMSYCLDKIGHHDQAQKLVYVAGHKVTTDTLAIPFSMGRNLICIHSKKHIDADPDTKPMKQKQNLAAMNGMLDMLRQGGACIWVAPSGGRDRRDLKTGKVPIAPFDQKTVDMFRLMGNKSKKPTNFYALSMVTYDLCPPPDFVEAGVGEQRNVRYVPVGVKAIALENVGGVESRHLFTEHAFEECEKGYNELLEKLGAQ